MQGLPAPPAHPLSHQCPASCRPAVQAPGSEAIMCLPSRLATVLEHAVVRRGVFAVAAPALSALRGLHTLSPLSPPDLESLIPALAACAARPETAAAAAALAPALARCTALHAHVLHAVLSARSPLMHHLGLEALRIYAKTCPGEALAAAVPPSMRSNPGGGVRNGPWPCLLPCRPCLALSARSHSFPSSPCALQTRASLCSCSSTCSACLARQGTRQPG